MGTPTKKQDNVSIIFTGIYAILLIVFGFIGFYKGGSLISLLSGGGLGVLLLGCSFGMKKNIPFCTFGAMGLTTILMASFFFRALASHKIVPTIFGSLSLCVFLILFYRTMKR